MSDWSVARISIATETVHHDLRFTDGRHAKDLLATQFLSLMDTYLPEGTSPIVLTANDCILEMPSGIMKGLRVTGQDVRNGVQRVLVTFRFFLGSMSALFQPGKAPSVLSEVECALSTRTINDIILPALSLAVTEPCAAAKQFPGAQEQLRASWEKLSEAQAEIAFYCDLISRFVNARDSRSVAMIDNRHSLSRERETNVIERIEH
ncbi:MAG: hypothetical protein AAF681_08790 [Pseudomonadota bacterium]